MLGATRKPGAPARRRAGEATLDTQWKWTVQKTIDEYLRATLEENLALLAQFPDYRFNFEGAFRYRLMKEYYPELYARLARQVQDGRWNVAGSSWEAGDVNIPSPEALFRNILYGNQYFNAHAGLKGFSTQKLSWGSANGIPFDIGRWIGPDGASIAAVLRPGGYGTWISSDWSNDPDILESIAQNGTFGVFAAYRYYGTGDIGGAPDAFSVSWIEQAITNPSGPAKVLSASSDQIYAGGSTFTQTIRLSAGDGFRVEVDDDVDWQTTATLLKAAFSLAPSNPRATYDLGLGTISRPNATSNLYEVPAQQWADITDVKEAMA